MPAAAPGRLRWRCRRGMKELDLLLERWLAERWDAAGGARQQAFAALLELPDPQLADWLLHGQRPPDAAFADLVDDILRARH